MEKSIKEKEHFEQYKNLIYSEVNKMYNRMRLRRSDVQFDDLLSEGFLIYSQCLVNFDESKNAKFSTYLTINLKGRLKDFYDFGLKEIKLYSDFDIINSNGEELQFEDTLSKNYDLDNTELLESAKDYLSYEAFALFNYILSMKWIGKRCVFSPTRLRKCTNLPKNLINSCLKEISEFWKECGMYVA